MHLLCVLLMLSADPSEAAARAQNNFARPPGVSAPSEKPERTRPARERDEGREKRERSKKPKREEAAPAEAPAPVLSGPAVDGVSAYFGVELSGADYGTVITALAERLNRQTLAGVSPEAELDRFRSVSKQMPRGKGQPVRLVDDLYRNMIDYLQVEAEFARKPTPKLLRRAEEIVESQIELDPNAPQERAEQIIEIMEANGQFPPPSIVFGIALRPYRPVKAPSGQAVLGVPTEPEYIDEDQRARAQFDFLTCPGPVCRIDFEAARVGELTLEQSTNGKNYTTVEAWRTAAPGGLQGPVLLARPVRARYLRVTATGGTEPPMLRNVQAAALKEPCSAVVVPVTTAPELDASFKEPAWPRQAEVLGFLTADGGSFAPQQTEVRVVQTADALYVAAYVRDDRLKTTVAKETARDAALSGDECFEVRLRPGRGEPLRFVVNPLGTQFDAQGTDASWNGVWQAVTKSYTSGWAAEIAIPFATLGMRPRQGDTLQVNFLRQRRNIVNEDSAWAAGRTEYGTLSF